jgi:hypothetical protein
VCTSAGAVMCSTLIASRCNRVDIEGDEEETSLETSTAYDCTLQAIEDIRTVGPATLAIFTFETLFTLISTLPSCDDQYVLAMLTVDMSFLA